MLLSSFLVYFCASMSVYSGSKYCIGIAVFFLVLQLLQSKGSTDKQALCEAWAQNKNLFILLVVFWATILLSALGSNEPCELSKFFWDSLFTEPLHCLHIVLFC